MGLGGLCDLPDGRGVRKHRHSVQRKEGADRTSRRGHGRVY
jgi:hypothetical protein